MIDWYVNDIHWDGRGECGAMFYGGKCKEDYCSHFVTRVERLASGILLLLCST